MTDILLILGSNIRKFRKEFGWTQQVLAEKSGISVPFMTQIELGRKSASLEVIQNIATALNISYKQLFDDEGFTVNKSMNLAVFENQLSQAILNTVHEEFQKLQVNSKDS